VTWKGWKGKKRATIEAIPTAAVSAGRKSSSTSFFCKKGQESGPSFSGVPRRTKTPGEQSIATAGPATKPSLKAPNGFGKEVDLRGLGVCAVCNLQHRIGRELEMENQSARQLSER